ncbi:MAG: hypothetical protein JXA96_06270 [Sedimentisphaerales bacterium]|nr:hypothetical protein [Sedimentisphaerales bacterium]
MRNYRLIWLLACTLSIILFAGQTANAVALNDSCANAISIGNVTNQAFNTTGATPDGPASSSMGVTPDIWYCYTATCTGTATISLCGSSFDTQLIAYNGCQCPATVSRELAYSDDASCGLQSELTLPVVCGNKYLIQIGGFSQATGAGVLTVSCSGTPCSSAPANDNCANATVIGNVTNLAFSTINATHDGTYSCVNGPNLWYKYTATCTGDLTISLCGSSFDTALAVYTGTSCTNLTPKGCNDDDDSCGYQSLQSALVINNAIAGKTYWIEVGGLSSSDKGTGVLTVSCGGQVQTASDLGDAPDNTNHFPSSNMRTYDHLASAKFPTVYQGNAIVGPIHLNPKSVAYLGNSVTYEDEADQGYDQDATNNLIPTQLNNNADKDLGDDGVVMYVDPYVGKTIGMTHCQLAAFDYKVNVIDPNVDMYVNVWFDWNRDGDWNDSGLTDAQLNCSSCSTGGVVNEWAVQNQLLFDLNTGLNTITTPGFLAWYPAAGDKKIWMRITLSDQPFKGGTGAAGSGPANGYDYGETEDYYFTPSENCTDCIDWDRNGTLDQNDLYTYMINYMWNWLENCASN